MAMCGRQMHILRDGRRQIEMLFDTANVTTLVAGIILVFLLGYIVNDK